MDRTALLQRALVEHAPFWDGKQFRFTLDSHVGEDEYKVRFSAAARPTGILIQARINRPFPLEDFTDLVLGVNAICESVILPGPAYVERASDACYVWAESFLQNDLIPGTDGEAAIRAALGRLRVAVVDILNRLLEEDEEADGGEPRSPLEQEIADFVNRLDLADDDEPAAG